MDDAPETAQAVLLACVVGEQVRDAYASGMSPTDVRNALLCALATLFSENEDQDGVAAAWARACDTLLRSEEYAEQPLTRYLAALLRAGAPLAD